MYHKMSVVKTSPRKVLFTGTEKQCEWFIDVMDLKVVADCPLGTSMWVR